MDLDLDLDDGKPEDYCHQDVVDVDVDVVDHDCHRDVVYDDGDDDNADVEHDHDDEHAALLTVGAPIQVCFDCSTRLCFQGKTKGLPYLSWCRRELIENSPKAAFDEPQF